MKGKFLAFIVLSAMSGVVLSHYSGPFLFWGLEHLNDMKIPTLQGEPDF
jgi:hypothetical protein